MWKRLELAFCPSSHIQLILNSLLVATPSVGSKVRGYPWAADQVKSEETVKIETRFLAKQFGQLATTEARACERHKMTELNRHLSSQGWRISAVGLLAFH